MNSCIIALSSITYALKAQQVMTDNVIRSKIVKLDSMRTQNGCSYGLEIDCANASNAEKLLNKHGIPYKGIESRSK